MAPSHGRFPDHLREATTNLPVHDILPSMNRQQMLQGREKLGGMGCVSGQQRGADVVYNHLANPFRAMVLVQQILAQRRGRDFWHMFMLGNGRDFQGSQAAKRDAVF